eukprot:jgi/Botrbrau1/20617/Bobra.113_1s0043.1
MLQQSYITNLPCAAAFSHLSLSYTQRSHSALAHLNAVKSAVPAGCRRPRQALSMTKVPTALGWSYPVVAHERRAGTIAAATGGNTTAPTEPQNPKPAPKIENKSVKLERPKQVPQTPKPQPTEEDWAYILELQEQGQTVNGKIRSVNRGGILLDVGRVSGFIPFSKMDPSRLPRRDEDQQGFQQYNVQDLQYLINKPISAKVVQVNKPEGKLVLSERAAMTSQLANQLKPGDIVDGIVTRLRDFGAFVSLRSPDGRMHGIEGMIHVSELSWKRVLTPESVVQTGSAVRCLVKRAQGQRIELSLKLPEEDPLMETFDSMLPPEEGRVEEMVPTQVPETIEAVCAALAGQSDISSVNLGRQVEEKSVVSQDLELWISREEVEGGYALVARAGRLVQEIRVSSDLSRDEMKKVVQQIVTQLN